MSGITAALLKHQAAQGARGSLQIQTSVRKIQPARGNASNTAASPAASEKGGTPPRFDQTLQAARDAQSQEQNRPPATSDQPAPDRAEKPEKTNSGKSKKKDGAQSPSADDVDDTQSGDVSPDQSDASAQSPCTPEAHPAGPDSDSDSDAGTDPDTNAAHAKEANAPDEKILPAVNAPETSTNVVIPVPTQIAVAAATVLPAQPVTTAPPVNAVSPSNHPDAPAAPADITEKPQASQGKPPPVAEEKPAALAIKDAPDKETPANSKATVQKTPAPTEAVALPSKAPVRPAKTAADEAAPDTAPDSTSDTAPDAAPATIPDTDSPAVAQDDAPARQPHVKEARPQTHAASTSAAQNSPEKLESPLPPVVAPVVTATVDADAVKQFAAPDHDGLAKSPTTAAGTSPLNITTGAAAQNDALHGAESAAAAQESTRPDAADPLDQIVLGLKGKLDARTGKAEIRLDPPNLGAVRVSVSLEHGALTAEFQSSSDVVRDLLKGNLEKLKTVLQGQGVTVDRLAVAAPAADASASRGPGQQPNFGTGSHDGRSAGQYQQDSRQNGNQRRAENESFARVLRQTADAPLDLVA